MKLTTAQLQDFERDLVNDLDSQTWDFIKSYTAQLCSEDTLTDEYESIREQLLTAQERLTISFT